MLFYPIDTEFGTVPSKFQNIENSFKIIIQNFNKSDKKINDILLFASDFSRVHPFGDGNGRTLDILTDLLLLKNGFNPLYFGDLKQKDELGFYKVLDEVYETRNVKLFYEFIEKHKSISVDNMKEKIKQALINAMLHYFNEMRSKISVDKHSFMEESFDKHMGFIADFVMENYINRGYLTQDFIKGLHKSLYPSGYKVDAIISGKRVVMIPGEYKTEDNGADSVLEVGKVNKFCDAKNVEFEMKKLIDNFNQGIATSENKKDLIFWFALDLSSIHPFGDGNGRVVAIMADILLLHNGLEPVNIHYYKEKDYHGIRKAGEFTIKNRDLKYLYDFIEKNYKV